MSDDTPPRRRRGQRPEPPPVQLTDAEIEKRLAGGASAGTVIERAPRAIDLGEQIGKSSGGRRSLILTALAAGLVLGLLAGVRFLLPTTPAAALASPTTEGSLTAVLPSSQGSPAPTPTASFGPVVDPSFFLDTPAPITPPPTVAPTTGPTTPPGPGATPRPKPTKTPAPTPNTTQAVITVIVAVTNDQGGNDGPGAWAITVNRSLDPDVHFQGTAGTNAILKPGDNFSVSIGSNSGYTAGAPTGVCSGTAVAGSQYTCTLPENDQPVTINVTIANLVPQTDAAVTVGGSNVVNGSFNGSGTAHVDANASYTVDGSTVGTVTPAGCSGTADEGAIVNCTLDYAQPAAPVGGLVLTPLVPFLRRRDRASA